MTTGVFTDEEIRSRSEKLKSVEIVRNELYLDLIPEDMKNEKLNEIYFQVFGMETMDIYLSREIFNTKSILISDFSSNGFFWAQNENEGLSKKYRELFDFLNNKEENDSKPVADLKIKWCIAEYCGEWFRAYIDKILDKNKIQIFFVDYGTTAIIDHSCTRLENNDIVWELPPLAVPFVLKDVTLTKFSKFKKMQYSFFHIMSLKLIEDTYIFEVELMDSKGTPLMELL